MISWWNRRSLRFRLSAWYALGGTLLLAAFSGTIYTFVDYHMARPLDHVLRQDLEVVQEHLVITADRQVYWRGQPVQMGEPWPPDDPWFEIWDAQGHLVRRFWPFIDSRLERLPAAPTRGRETISVFDVAADVRLRALSVPFAVAGDEGWMLRVMNLHEPSVNALRPLLFIIAVALPVVVVVLVVGGYLVTRRWLKPLDLMVSEAHRITATDLNRRLPILNPEDELGRLAAVFNTTLSRLEDSFKALDRFVADAAHELLTPLSTLRSVGEVGLRAERTVDEYREIVGSMLEEAQRLQLLVEKLLQLARAEGGAPIAERKPVRLDELARQCAEDASILAEEKQQRLSVAAQPATANTDTLLLRQALQNLLDNAIKYSPVRSEIRLEVSAVGENWVISVIDQGPGIKLAHRPHLTERFFRADAARSPRGGFGLGLAITQAYLRVLGGELRFESRENEGSTFQLVIPRERMRDAEGADA
jgi:heavy metal sensor kinase